MKKYLLTLVVFIFGLFFLASCDIKTNNTTQTDESQTTPSKDDDAKQTESDESKPKDDDPQQITPQEDVYFDVVFKDYDGTVLQTSQVKEGTIPTYNKSNPIRSNDENYKYEFSGWSPEITAVTSNITYIAQYNQIPYSNYTITFKDYDGTVLQTSQVKEGTIPTYNKSIPTRPNDENYKYEFTGWSPEITIVTSNTTYTAMYRKTELPYTISFDLDGGTSKSGVSTIKIETLTKDKFKFDITKSKYVFRGWEYNGTQVFDENGNIINNIQLSSNMTFKAIYEENVTLTITYSIYNPKTNQLIKTYNTKPNDLGNVSETRSYHYNTPVNLFANPNEGYTFIGWYYNGLALSNESNYNYMMWEDNITLDARFEYSKYDLNVWSNNTDLGQVMIRNGNSQVWYDNQTQKQYYTESTTIAAFTKTDTRFLGWYDENNNLVSTSAVYTFNMPNKNYTLEAKWNYFNITYDLDGGTNNINNPTSYNKDMNNIELLNPTKEGYTFHGWEYNGNYITEIETSKLCNMELLAIFSPNTDNKHTIILDNRASGVKITGIRSGNEYGFDSRITLVATNIPFGYTIKWTRNDGVITSGNKYSFNVPANDLTIIATITGPYTRDENKVYFGTYPQTKVTDNALITELNILSGTKPTAISKYNWIDYNYYISSNVTSYMYYQDIDYDNDGSYDYRGVYFTQYRPRHFATSSTTSTGYQDDTGYLINTIYWFSYDPIEWNILTESDGKALTIANLILDSQDYYPSSSTSGFSHNGGSGYASNYELSNIRKFLSETFYNVAFSNLQKTLIETIEVDNSASSTGDSSNKYAGKNNTIDKMFLLSYKEAITYFTCKEERETNGTDYAKCQGLLVESSDSYDGNSRWWLRSPDNYYEFKACYVASSGNTNDSSGDNKNDSVGSIFYGVRPACWIVL